jgi:hypothetical protein
MLSAGERWREQWLALQQRRFARDHAALHGTLDAMREASDWNDFAAGSQAVLRDYLSASAAIWQDGVAAAMQGAGAWSDTTRDALLQWQQSMSRFQPGSTGGGALPMREWMAAFERAVSPVPAAEDEPAHAARRSRERRARSAG